MYKKKKILCVIPARSGSKGILNKNLQLINKKPLLFYPIRAAKNSRYIDKIIFVTFPHYTHIFGYNIISNQKETYNVNVSDIVEKTVINHQKIYHLNFSELADSGKIKIKRDSYYGDAASHTTVEFHSKVFTKQIINFLK